jgi:hypothetical protein
MEIKNESPGKASSNVKNALGRILNGLRQLEEELMKQQIQTMGSLF